MPQADYLLNELLGELATSEPAQEIVVGTCQDEFDHESDTPVIPVKKHFVTVLQSERRLFRSCPFASANLSFL